MKNKKKGFTLLELVIVIAVFAVLMAILIPTFAGIIRRAKLTADQTMVKNLNTMAYENEKTFGKATTIREALAVAKENNFDVEALTPTADGAYILWDSVNDRWILFDAKENKIIMSDKNFKVSPKHSLWNISNIYNDEEGYSVYLKNGYTGDTSLTINTGLDVGNNTNIISVNYERLATDNPHTVTIQTNSSKTTLTVNAPLDTVYHYGNLGVLDIIESATESYHENGQVAFVEITKGRMVLEDGAEITKLHINANESNNGFNEVIIADNGAKSLPEKITRDKVTVTTQTLVVKVESNNTVENVYVYADGTIGSTAKTATQNTNVESTLGQLVIDNGQPKALTEDEKSSEIDDVAVEAINAKTDYGDSVARVGEVGYDTLQNAINAANPGSTVVLLQDVEISTNQTVDGTNKYAIGITKSIILNGDNHIVTAKTDRVVGMKGTNLSNMIDVKIKNITLIASNHNGAQVIMTRDYVNSLTLENVVADNTYATSGYVQAITIGGSDPSAIRNIFIKDSVIKNQPNKYYTMIFWAPVNLNLVDSELIGWSPLYFKPDSAGSTVSIKGGKLSCVGVEGNSNSFGLINFESGAIGIPVTIENTDIDIKTTATVSHQAIVSFSPWYGPNNGSVVTIAGGSIKLDGTNAIFVMDNGAENSLTIRNCKIDDNGTISSSYSYTSPELTNQVAYMYVKMLNNVETIVCDGYFDFEYLINHSSSWFCNGEWLEFYSETINLTKDATFGMASSAIGTFGLILGNSTIATNGHKLTIAQGVTIKTDVRLNNVFAAPDGYELVETVLANDATYAYSYTVRAID